MDTIDLFDTFPSPRTESVFIAGLLTRPEWVARAAAEGADATWVLTPAYAAIARAAFDGFALAGAFTVDTIYALLEERHELGRHMVEPTRFVDLCSLWVDDASFDDALRRLAQGAHLRRLWLAVETLRENVFASGSHTLSERTERLESGLGSLVSFAAGRVDTLHTGADLARLAMEASEFVPTGIWSLDESVRGYVPGRVTVVAGRPSHGKTALGLELALRMARRQHQGEGQIVYFSSEMGAQPVGHRLIAHLSGLNSRDVMDRRYRKGEEAQAERAAETLAALPLVIDEVAAPTTAYFLGRCLALSAIAPVRLLVFDYLQYTGERAENRRLSLDVALRGLHETAKRLHCPVVCLAQLNREIDRRGGSGEPQLSDMKETGALEEVPALVLMCHHPWTHAFQLARPRRDLDEIDPREFAVYVRKNTHGPLGKVTLDFERETGRFTDHNEAIL